MGKSWQLWAYLTGEVPKSQGCGMVLTNPKHIIQMNCKPTQDCAECVTNPKHILKVYFQPVQGSSITVTNPKYILQVRNQAVHDSTVKMTNPEHVYLTRRKCHMWQQWYLHSNYHLGINCHSMLDLMASDLWEVIRPTACFDFWLYILYLIIQYFSLLLKWLQRKLCNFF